MPIIQPGFRLINKYTLSIALIFVIVVIVIKSVGGTSKKEEEKLKVYPNPVFESFSIEFTLETTTPLTIEVKDVAGKVVKQLFAGKANQGLNHFSFNKANLAAGTYFLVISNPSSIIKNEKIIINN